jgi:hypothetical protein
MGKYFSFHYHIQTSSGDHPASYPKNTRGFSPRDKATRTGPYYPLGTIGTVPWAYDIFRAYKGMEGEK